MSILNYIFLFSFPWLNQYRQSEKISGWIGPRPSFWLWIKFLKESKIKFGKEVKVGLLEFEEIKEIQNTTKHFSGQIIRKNNWVEKNLLNRSTLYFFPHEVFQIRVINTQNIDFSTKIYHGKKNKCSTKAELSLIIKEIVLKARKELLQIEEIEIMHTHPSLEVLIADETQSKFVFNGLSETDIKTTQEIAEFVNYPLRIKAVTPSVNYSMLF